MSAHFLVVHPWDEDAEPSDLIEVEHAADCPTEVLDWRAPDGQPVTAYNCAVQFCLDDCGLDEWFVHADAPPVHGRHVERVSPGRHEIEAWDIRYQTECGVEYDGGLQLVERAA